MDGFGWRSSDSKCVKNCSKSFDPNAGGLSTSILECTCEPGFFLILIHAFANQTFIGEAQI